MQVDPTAEIHPLPHDYLCHALKFFPSSHLTQPFILCTSQILSSSPPGAAAPCPGNRSLSFASPVCSEDHLPSLQPSQVVAARSPTLWSQEVALCPLGSSQSPSGPAPPVPCPPVNIQQTLVLLLSYTASPSPHWYCVPTSWMFPPSQRLWSPFTSIFKP